MTRTLSEKLGLKPGMPAIAIGRPETLKVLDLPACAKGEVAMIIAFVASSDAVAPRLAEALPHYRRGGAMWFAYPKRTGKIATDISRDRGWEPLAACDLLPVSQVAIDDTWSALRFRYRDEIVKLTRKF